MTSPLKKLLVLGALLWVAPLGAEPRDSTDRSWSHDESGCPEERAEAARTAPATGKTDAPLFARHARASALLP